MATKTNSMRVLDGLKIAYEVHTFSPEIHSADEVAGILGYPTSQVYKTLVVMRDKGRPLLVMVGADRELDLKKLAKAVGEKRLRMATHKEAESLTGLKVGGISALALLSRGFEVLIDQTALGLERVLVSAGQRGINLRLRVDDLTRATGAKAVEAT
jgi:Cys-tRNA(Pro)/Cys-tRNA(Cys) deacylase